LASCGLNASQTTNDDLKVVLNNFLNGGKDTGFGVVMPACLLTQQFVYLTF